jgi:hypothetical protein
MKKKFLCLSANHLNRFYIYPAVLALLLGGMIYILLRATEPVFFRWIRAVGLGGWFNVARHSSVSLRHIFPEWIVFSLPNGLWAFAYALIITGIWSDSKSWLKYFWLASIPLLVLGYEILQYTGTIPGTFCMQDIAMGTAGLITGILVGTKTIKPNNHENTSQ